MNLKLALKGQAGFHPMLSMSNFKILVQLDLFSKLVINLVMSAY